MRADLLAAWQLASSLAAFFQKPDAALLSSDALRQEYEDLFMGTNADIFIPLWASACEDENSSLMDRTTLAVIHAYHRAGYAYIPMDGNPPDYIGQQLRFVCYLIACTLHETRAGRSGAHYTEMLDSFFSAHLLPTAEKVAAGIRAHSKTALFLRIAGGLEAVCRLKTAGIESAGVCMRTLACYDSYEHGPAAPIPDGEVQTIRTAGRNNCGGKCSILATVQDGCLLRLESGCDTGEPSIRACVRGHGYRGTFLTPKRLRYPMERIGRRGEGRFRRISWEEATNRIAAQWTRIRDTYGPCSRYVNYGTGTAALIRPDLLAMRLLNLDGGFLGRYGSYSSACTSYVTPYVYGDNFSGNSTEDILNTRLLILWGHNPTETIFSPQLSYTIARAREQGTKVVVIDPRRSDTAIALADEWIPIIPGTDAALADAMAYVIWSEGLQDQAFMDRYCLGFDETHMPEGVPAELNYQNYLFGGLDGTVKTPEWAAPITGIDAGRIRALARAYANAKPACLLPGLGNQRTGNGEQTARGMMMLTCLTGNVGIPGGGAAGHGEVLEEPKPRFPAGEAAYPGVISCFLWMHAVEHGAEMTREKDHIRGVEQLDSNIKLLFSLASNVLINQHADINHTAEVLQDESKLEYIISSDVFMTPSARFADLLLPAPSFLEEENIALPWMQGHYLLFHNKVIEPLFGCRTEYDWLSDTAKRLGLWDAWSEGRETHTQWLEHLYSELRRTNPELPQYAVFKQNGGFTYPHPRATIAYADQIRDPGNHPFATPSGKIEICSAQLYDLHDPEIPAIPCYRPCPEGPEDPLRETYPLQLIGWHTKRRCHSIHDNNPLMEEIDPQRMWMHPDDARARGVVTGDRAEVFNDRGRIRIPVLVTERIMRGVVAIAQGAWYTPGSDGIDARGSINVLTADRPTPLAKGNPQHTNLVEVRRC